MLKSFKKKSDIEDLQKLILELGVEIDLKTEDLDDYETPDYNLIK